MPELRDFLPPPPWEGPPLPRALAALIQPSIFKVKRSRLDTPYHFLASGGVNTRSHVAVHSEAYRGKTYVGFIEYAYSPARGGAGLGEIEMVVSAFPGTGVGRSLVQHAEEEMRRQGVKSIGLVASGAHGGGGVRGFWEKMGYRAARSYPPAWDFMEKDLTVPTSQREEEAPIPLPAKEGSPLGAILMGLE